MRTPPGLSVASERPWMIMPPCARPFGEVAVVPDAGEALEIGGAVFLAVGIVPELHRHRGERHGADQLALAFGERLAVRRIDVHRHAEAGRLDLALPHRRGRIAEHEARHDVGAARDRGEVHVGFDVAVDVFEAFRRQRRAGRGDHPQRRELVRAHRRDAGLAAGVDVFRRGAEHGDALVLRIVPERGRRRARTASRHRASASRRSRGRRSASSTSSSRAW